ncbi:MAG: hypothetical protein LBQ46_01500 [Treponema sp.]|jgi:hypothetical protein|nr:hypothetical protein [Treponema sp.]
MKKLSVIFIITIGALFAGCKHDAASSVNPLIGCWRSESTTVSQQSGGIYYDVFIFEDVRVYEFYLHQNSIQYIKNVPLDDTYWRDYTLYDDKFVIHYISEAGVTINVDIAYAFSGGTLILTFPQSIADSKWNGTRTIAYVNVP